MFTSLLYISSMNRHIGKFIITEFLLTSMTTTVYDAKEYTFMIFIRINILDTYGKKQ